MLVWPPLICDITPSHICLTCDNCGVFHVCCVLNAILCCADGCPTLTNMLVIIVGGIPIAMPTVLNVTLALGAFKLAKEGAIVARMSAVEEMAGTVLLTQSCHNGITGFAPYICSTQCHAQNSM